MFRCLFSTIVFIACLILLNAFLCFSSHSNFLFLLIPLFDSSGRSGAEIVTKFGIDLA